MGIAEWLRLARADLEMTQHELSEAMGVSFETYRRWENGVNTPGKKGLAVIGEYYEEPVESLKELDR